MSSLAFIIEAVDTIYACTLVVASQKEKILWEFDFVGKEQADCLKRLLTSVDVVSKEQIIGVWRKPAILKQSQKVIVVAVNIT